MFGGLSPWEILLIFLVVLLFFGAKRLPEIGSSLGKGIREFKGSLREIEGELKLPEERREGGASKPDSRSEPKSESNDGEDGNNGEPRRLTTTQ